MICPLTKIVYVYAVVFLLLVARCYPQDAVVCPVKCSCSLIQISSFDRIRVKCGGDIRIHSIGELNLYSNLTDIISLDLSGNGINRIGSKAFPLHELQKLDLNKNEIELIEEGAFDGLAGLKRLDLSHNKIRVITRGMFDGLVSLEKLKISQNLINHVKEGTFDSLVLLRTLDISGNPLVCDCDLWWLGGWNASGQVKLSPMPKCARPKDLRNQPLRKLRPPLSCPWLSDNLPAPLELSPDQDQVVFEGDSLQLDCRVSAVSLSQPDSQLTWYWAGLLPHSVFSPSQVDTKTTNNNGLLESSLIISELELNHTGEWNCELISSSGNHSSTLSVIVLSDSTKYCMPSVTVDNKGSYSWPKTVAGHVVELPCQAEIGLGYARYNCTLDGRWSSLNTSVCPFVSETTRILQQYARMNLTAIRGNIVENAERLHNYTLENKANLIDPMDIVFLTQTIENLVQFVSKEKRLGVLLLDLISNSMDLSKELLAKAQEVDLSCAKLILTVETITQYIPSLESHKANMAVEEFPVSRESFVGMTCTWLKGLSGKPSDRLFQCSVGNKSGLNVPQDKVLEASVEIPPSIVHQVQAGQFHQLLVAMFDNDKLFPSQVNSSTVVASSIVGTKLVGIKESAVGGSVVVTLGGVVGGGGRVRPAWWDPVASKWSTQACQPSHIVHDLLVLHCNRLGYYTLLRDTQHYNLLHRREQAKSRYASPFIYAGTFIGCTCMLVASFTYAVCHSSIMITSKMKHSLANNWIAISSLCIIFSVGMYQTEDVYICQSIGLLIHYFTLCSLFWMAISINGLHRGVRRREAVVSGSVSEAEAVGQPTLGQYLVGWGVSSLLVGLSGAVNPSGYAAPTYCCLGPGPGFTPLLVPIFALFVFIITRSLMVRSAAGEKDSNGQLSEGTQATDLELLEGGASAERCTSAGTERCLGPACTERCAIGGDRCLGPGCTEMTERASVRSLATPSSHLEDPEHSPCVHLKASIIVIITFSLIWTTAALSVLKPMGLPYEETVFSIIYCVLIILMGVFIIYFYCFSRSDVRTVWFTLKPLVRSRNIRDSRCAPPSSPRNSLTNSIGLKSISSRPEPQGETLKTNLLDMHRRQYSANRIVTEDSFYNPHQNVVARKFFKKQRRLRGVNRRSGDGGGSDTASDLFRVNRCPKRPLERLVIGAEASDSGRYASVVSECCSCHVSEAHSDCRDIVSDRSSRSSHVYATVAPPGRPCCGSPRHRLALDPAREQVRIKLSPSRHSHEHDKRETPV